MAGCAGGTGLIDRMKNMLIATERALGGVGAVGTRRRDSHKSRLQAWRWGYTERRNKVLLCTRQLPSRTTKSLSDCLCILVELPDSMFAHTNEL